MSSNNKKALVVKDISMLFNLSSEKQDSLKEFTIALLTGKRQKKDEFWALKNINFTLEPGDRLGILGFNGAGKSTLLKVISGVYRPTTGYVKKSGIIAPLLELGAGFDMEYTARENIFLYGAVLGYKKDFIESKFDEIVEFSELQKFIDVPLKNYSSGMKTRLGFSICTAVNPDILILDEVLSVGDAKFQRKSLNRVEGMMENNTTVLFVSHSTEQVVSVCNKALLLDHGNPLAFGSAEEVAEIYQNMTNK